MRNLHQTTDCELSKEAWNKLSSQMTEMAETNMLFKRAVKNTYKKVNSIPNPPLIKFLTPQKLPRK